MSAMALDSPRGVLLGPQGWAAVFAATVALSSCSCRC